VEGWCVIVVVKLKRKEWGGLTIAILAREFFLVVFQRRSHRGVCALNIQSVTVNQCMYMYIVI